MYTSLSESFTLSPYFCGVALCSMLLQEVQRWRIILESSMGAVVRRGTSPYGSFWCSAPSSGGANGHGGQRLPTTDKDTECGVQEAPAWGELAGRVGC